MSPFFAECVQLQGGAKGGAKGGLLGPAPNLIRPRSQRAPAAPCLGVQGWQVGPKARKTRLQPGKSCQTWQSAPSPPGGRK